jgi:hypothetical protein
LEESIVVGTGLVVLSLGLLWFFMPRQGQSSKWMAVPFVESLVPLTIVVAFTVGVTMLAEYWL